MRVQGNIVDMVGRRDHPRLPSWASKQLINAKTNSASAQCARMNDDGSSCVQPRHQTLEGTQHPAVNATHSTETDGICTLVPPTWSSDASNRDSSTFSNRSMSSPSRRPRLATNANRAGCRWIDRSLVSRGSRTNVQHIRLTKEAVMRWTPDRPVLVGRQRTRLLEHGACLKLVR